MVADDPVILGFYSLCGAKNVLMNQCCQPHCHNFFSSKYNVCPKTVELKKSKMAGEALPVLFFLFFYYNPFIVSDTRSEFKPIAKSWWIIKSVVSVQSKNLEKAMILLGEPRENQGSGGEPDAEKRKDGTTNSRWDKMS